MSFFIHFSLVHLSFDQRSHKRAIHIPDFVKSNDVKQ